MHTHTNTHMHTHTHTHTHTHAHTHTHTHKEYTCLKGPLSDTSVKHQEGKKDRERKQANNHLCQNGMGRQTCSSPRQNTARKSIPFCQHAISYALPTSWHHLVAARHRVLPHRQKGPPISPCLGASTSSVQFTDKENGLWVQLKTGGHEPSRGGYTGRSFMS